MPTGSESAFVLFFSLLYSEDSANTEEPVSHEKVRTVDIHQWVKEAQEGNQEAFAYICRQFAGLVKKYAFQAHVRAIAEEAEAQGWLALTEAVKAYDGKSQVPFPGFAESRVKYAVWNLFKKERRRWQQEYFPQGWEEDSDNPLEALPDEMSVERKVENRFLSEELAQAMDELPEKQRRVIVDVVIHEKTLAQTAALLGISVQAVHHLKNRGLARLKKRCAGM